MKRARLPVLLAFIGCLASSPSHAGGLRIAPREAAPGVADEKPATEAVPGGIARPEPGSAGGLQGGAPGAESEEPAWSAVGIWEAKLASEQAKITLRKDGTLSKDDGEPGRWSLTGEQGKVILVLRWETRGTESVEMVNGNYFRGASPDGAIELRRTPAKAAANRAERTNARLAILSAMYGIEDQRVDVTLELQALVQDGWLGIPANWRLGRIDPAQGEAKDVVIQYRSEDGRNRTARFKEDEPIVLPKE